MCLHIQVTKIQVHTNKHVHWAYRELCEKQWKVSSVYPQIWCLSMHSNSWKIEQWYLQEAEIFLIFTGCRSETWCNFDAVYLAFTKACFCDGCDQSKSQNIKSIIVFHLFSSNMFTVHYKYKLTHSLKNICTYLIFWNPVQKQWMGFFYFF